MNNSFTFFEYERKTKHDLIKKGMTERDFKNITTLNKRWNVTVLKVLEHNLKATSYVGVVSTGIHTIQIFPKISKYGNVNEIVRNLLYMLSYTKKINIRETEISRLCQRKENKFFEIFIYLFAKNLMETLKRNFYKNYYLLNDDLYFIRGKIAFNENLKRNLIDKHKINCIFSEFTGNILLNQVFRYTVFLLLKLTNDRENYKLLKQLEFTLSDVTLKRITLNDFTKIHLNRLNRYFEPILQLSKILISQSCIQLFHDKLETFSFVFDMNDLFEEFITEFIKRNKAKIFPDFVKVKSKDKSKKLVDLPKPQFTLIPDILIQHKETKMIIDTKYKELNPQEKKLGISESDLYQMLAYALKHQSEQVILLYPEHSNITTPLKPFIIKYDHNEINIYIRTIPLDIDLSLKDSRTILINHFKNMCSPIFAS